MPVFKPPGARPPLSGSSETFPPPFKRDKMYRYHNPTQYANSLAKAHRGRQSRSRSQSRQRHPSNAPKQYKNGGRRRRGGLRDDLGQAPQRVTYAEGPRGRGGLRGNLKQRVVMDDPSHTQLFIQNKGGVHQVVPFDPAKYRGEGGKVYNGPVVDEHGRIFIANGNSIHGARNQQEVAMAQNYAQKLYQMHANKQHPPQRQQQQPRRRRGPPGIAKNPYGIYELISSRLATLRDLSKDAEATTFKNLNEYPVELDLMLKGAKQVADDLMESSNFFEGRNEKYIPGVILQYLHHGMDLSQMQFKDGTPPKFLSDFDAVLKGTSNATPHEKYSAVYSFVQKLGGTIRKVINGQAKHVRVQKQNKEIAHAMAATVPVEGDHDDLRSVENAIVDKLMGMDKEALDALKMTPKMNQLIPLQFALKVAESIGEKNLNFTNFIEYIVKNHEDLTHFVMARSSNFRDAVKKAKSILSRRRFVEKKKAEKAAMPHPSTAAAASQAAVGKPGAGMASGLVSMRY